ncbi:hypothetical protein [Sinomonas atrocyanea]|uniref:hypothetical protein n=1 Tax=Sinomonas atrocyanea TaxID=37927 RepID=UPI001141C5D4|nr:hypothetical protein [Sinomonas atrocyanea]
MDVLIHEGGLSAGLTEPDQDVPEIAQAVLLPLLSYTGRSGKGAEGVAAPGGQGVPTPHILTS